MRILLWVPLLCGMQAASEPLRLPCTADTVICMAHGEETHNGGGRSNLRVKGIENITIQDYDVSSLKGKTVDEARLFFVPLGEHKLRLIGVSTIGTPWKEGQGEGGPAKPGEACFLEAARGQRSWGGPGSDFHSVTYGRGGSLWTARALKSEADGWASIDVPPAFLHALVEGNAFGLAISDDNGQTGHNNNIYSREQTAKAPYLLVTRWHAGTAPASGAKKYEAPAPKKPADRAAEFALKAAAPAAVQPAALADGCRYRVLHDGETHIDAAPAARLWDGRSVSLDAARGEAVAFEIAVEIPQGQTRAVRFEGAGWTVCAALPVGSSYDPLVPVDGEASGKVLYHVERLIPKGASTGAQTFPLTLKTGKAEVAIPVSVKVHSATLPDVLGFHVSLNGYNSPGENSGEAVSSPGFLDLERSYHRLAHEHRATIATVPYSHRGNIQSGHIPEVKRAGTKVEVLSWKAYDERWGPYFDGSAFKGLPREGVPMDHFYWPMHENFPLPINEYYSYKGSPENHWKDAPLPEQAFAPEYGKAFGAMVAEFGRHAQSKGWTKTMFQVYLNNKPDVRFDRHQPEGAWWRLDEPVSLEDHLALRYFGLPCRDGAREAAGVQIKYRADLSRPQCRRDTLDGVLGLAVVAGTYRQYPDLVFNRGEDVWIYGGVPGPGGSGQAARAWILQVFLDGGDGVVPWLALGTQKAWSTPEDTALVLPPKPGMEKRAYATLRLKGLRRGEQDVELLRLLLAKMKAGRDEVRAGLAESLGLLASFRKTSEEDAGRVEFGKLDPERFEAFRRGVLEALDR